MEQQIRLRALRWRRAEAGRSLKASYITQNPDRTSEPTASLASDCGSAPGGHNYDCVSNEKHLSATRKGGGEARVTFLLPWGQRQSRGGAGSMWAGHPCEERSVWLSRYGALKLMLTSVVVKHSN